MKLTKMRAVEINQFALALAQILTDGLDEREIEVVLRILCFLRDDIGLILSDKRNAARTKTHGVSK
ncbi:MAG: hypothetical protein MSA47_06365 [Christensenellaceae bacterium]|nr:hypothetical protein [Christensenellaceae bacterium]